MFIVVPRPAPAPVSVRHPVPGIERPLVGADEEHARILVEDVLRAVAVVRVEVEDPDPFTGVGERSGDDGDVRDEAEPHRLRAGRVVPGRPDRTERSGSTRRPAARELR